MVDTAAVWTEQVRTLLDTQIGYALDYGSTLEGDWTAAIGEAAFVADQGVQIAIDGLDPRTATGAALDRAVAPIVTRRPATQSLYTVTVDDDATIPGDTLLRDPDGRSWKVIEGGGIVTAGDELVVESVDTGPIALSEITPSALVPITGLARPSDLTYTPGDEHTVGRDEETDAQLRRRWSRSIGRPNAPTGPGIHRTLLAIEWVTAASAVRTGPGELAIYIVPAPVGTTQEDELGEAIYRCIAASDVTTGAESVVVVGADGQDVTVYWTNGTTETVAVVTVLTLASGVALASVSAAVEAAIRGVFDGLDVGGTLYRLAVLTAIGQVAGVTGCTLTLAGGGGNVVPALATNLLVPGTVTIS